MEKMTKGFFFFPFLLDAFEAVGGHRICLQANLYIFLPNLKKEKKEGNFRQQIFFFKTDFRPLT